MDTVSERVHLMKRDFMGLHAKGFSIPEIAAQYSLSYSTVYKHLQEIADKNGVTRGELLQIARNGYNRTKWREEEEKMKLDIKEMNEGFKKARNTIDKIVYSIDKLLEEEE